MAEDSQKVEIFDSSNNRISEIEDGVRYTVVVSGSRNDQAPASGTSISLSSDEADIMMDTTFTVPVTRSKYRFPLLVQDADDTEESNLAFINFRVTTPKGVVNGYSIDYSDL